MKICSYGVGGVGGYIGSIMVNELKSNHEFYFVARNKHKNAIIENGLTLKKDGGSEIITVFPDRCVDSVDELPVCDIIIVSVKSYDLAHVADALNKIASENTLVLPLLNGVDIYERIREHFTRGIVLPSCIYVGTYIESPGVIYQKGGSCKIFIGKDPRFPDIYPETLLSLLTQSHVDFSWEENILVAIWSKFMFIAAYGLVGAAFDKTLGQMTDDPLISQQVKSIMTEIKAIATALHIDLDNDIVESSFSKARQFPPETRTSFQRDIALKGSVNESDLFAGSVIRYGQSLGIPAPATIDVSEKLTKTIGAMT